MQGQTHNIIIYKWPKALSNRTNSIYKKTSVSKRLNIVYIVFNTFRPVMCEGWHLTYKWKSFT